MKAMLSLCFILGSVSVPAVASANIDLSKINYGGNGCAIEGEGIRPYLRESTGRLVIRMPDMNINIKNQSLDRKSCALAIPVTVNLGEQLMVSDPSVFGDESMTHSAQLDIRSEIFAAGENGPAVEKSIIGQRGPSRGFYERLDGTLVFACGVSPTLRINNSILGRKSTTSGGGQANLEGVALTLRVVKCIRE